MHCRCDNGNLAQILRELAADPRGLLVARWNWKSALLSSLFRGGLFFAVNLRAGIHAASGALLAESIFRLATAGFYGALTPSFRNSQPAWHGVLAVVLLLPVVQHSLEFAVHWLRGTPMLAASIAASAVFSVISTLFNFHLMRNGVMIVGQGQRPLREDLAAMPKLLLRPFRAAPDSR